MEKYNSILTENFYLKDLRGDGDCLFRSLAYLENKGYTDLSSEDNFKNEGESMRESICEVSNYFVREYVKTLGDEERKDKSYVRTLPEVRITGEGKDRQYVEDIMCNNAAWGTELELDSASIFFNKIIIVLRSKPLYNQANPFIIQNTNGANHELIRNDTTCDEIFYEKYPEFFLNFLSINEIKQTGLWPFIYKVFFPRLIFQGEILHIGRWDAGQKRVVLETVSIDSEPLETWFILNIDNYHFIPAVLISTISKQYQEMDEKDEKEYYQQVEKIMKNSKQVQPSINLTKALKQISEYNLKKDSTPSTPVKKRSKKPFLILFAAMFVGLIGFIISRIIEGNKKNSEDSIFSIIPSSDFAQDRCCNVQFIPKAYFVQGGDTGKPLMFFGFQGDIRSQCFALRSEASDIFTISLKTSGYDTLTLRNLRVIGICLVEIDGKVVVSYPESGIVGLKRGTSVTWPFQIATQDSQEYAPFAFQINSSPMDDFTLSLDQKQSTIQIYFGVVGAGNISFSISKV